jgi:hypothetical protein
MSPTATTTRKRRSPLAPAYSVEHCFDAASRLQDKFGRERFDQDAMAGVLGVSAGASTTDRLVSSLRQFGLVDKSEIGLSLTDRQRGLRFARSEGDTAGFREIALEAVDAAAVYQEMRGDFGVKLPPEDALIARFEEKGFTQRSARQTARALSESLRFAGVLDDDDNIISDLEEVAAAPEASETEESAEVTPIDEVDFEEAAAAAKAVEPAASEEAFLARPRIDVPLGTGRSASVLYPAGMTRSEVEKIYGVLDALIKS